MMSFKVLVRAASFLASISICFYSLPAQAGGVCPGYIVALGGTQVYHCDGYCVVPHLKSRFSAVGEYNQRSVEVGKHRFLKQTLVIKETIQHRSWMSDWESEKSVRVDLRTMQFDAVESLDTRKGVFADKRRSSGTCALIGDYLPLAGE